jgi:hypothetical protein
MTEAEEDFTSFLIRRYKELDFDTSAKDTQVGGNHYKDCKIQPVDYIHANELDFFEGNIVKYTTRHRKKGSGSQDIRKVIHYAELILELVYNEKP